MLQQVARVGRYCSPRLHTTWNRASQTLRSLETLKDENPLNLKAFASEASSCLEIHRKSLEKRLPEAPGGSRRLPVAPRSFRKLPETPGGSRKLLGGSRKLPEAPRKLSKPSETLSKPSETLAKPSATLSKRFQNLLEPYGTL